VERVAQSARPGWRAVCGWLAAYAVLSLLFCAPFVRLSTLDLTPDWGDARLITWTLAWHARWPVTGEWPLDAPMFAPEPRGLANSEPMIALGLGAAPLTALAGPVVAFNVLRLLLPVTNALAMAFLVWYYLRDDWAAFIAGLALGFAYAQVATVYIGLIHLAVLAGFALAPIWLDRWWRSGHARDLAIAVAIACVQSLVSWYAAVLVLLVLLVQVTWLFATGHLSWHRALTRAATLGAAAAVAGAVLWPIARPFLGAAPPSVEELRTFSLLPSYFAQPPVDTWAGALLQGGAAGTAPWDYRRSYFVGVTAGLAAAAGAVAALTLATGRRMLWAVPLGVLGFALSLGPSGPGTGWRPFDLVSMVPGVLSFRAPGRMAVLVSFAVAMLAGIAMHATPARYRRGVLVLLVAGSLAEGVMVYRPRPAVPSLPTPSIFARLAADSPTVALVVPMLANTPAWPAEADYLLFASRAWTPLVNGYGRRTPPIYQAIFDTVARAPQAPLGDVLRFYGVSHIVVLPRYEPARAAAFIAAADASPDVERVAESDGDVLYRVRPEPAARRRPDTVQGTVTSASSELAPAPQAFTAATRTK